MKTLTLNLKKKIFIIEDKEHGSYFPPRCIDYRIEKDNETYKLICKGSELKEDMLFNIVIGGYCSTNGKYLYKDYNSLYDDECFNYALESFISAIEAQGYGFGKVKVDLSEPNHENKCDVMLKFNQTFNPDKTLIFEIL